MSRKTTYYELVQPDYNDTADIEVLNSNMDIIDEALNKLKNQSGGGTSTDLTELTNKVNANTEAIENLDATKADKSTTLSGYGITDGVTKTELDDAIAGVSGGGGGGTVDAYTKTQTDELLNNKVDKEAGKGLFSGSYNDLTDAPTIPSKTSELQNDSGYLTEHQDLSSYAKKTDIPSLNGYATEQWVGEQGYLTEHQDLSGYAKKTEIPTVPTKVSAFENDKGYLTEHQDLSAYATTTTLQTVANSLLNNTKAVDNSLKTLIRRTVSDEWNDTTTYEVGQYCIFSNRLWKCLIRNSGKTPQKGTYWTQTSIDNEIAELNSNIAKLGTSVPLVYMPGTDSFTTGTLANGYKVSEFRELQLYLCNASGSVLAESKVHTDYFKEQFNSDSKLVCAFRGLSDKAYMYYINETTIGLYCTTNFDARVRGIY